MLSEGKIDMGSGVGFYSDGEQDGEMIDMFDIQHTHPYISWYKK